MRQFKEGIILVAALFLIFTLSFLAIQISRTANGQNPVASFIYSPNMPTPTEIITFNASLSSSANGAIVNYTWDFGDGYTVVLTSPTVTHLYPLDGNYTVQLIVTDNVGLTAATAAVVQVNCVQFFRVTQPDMLTPVANVVVTVYTNKTGTWAKAPVSGSDFEIKYDNLTQPKLANTNAERFRNPGFTASILLCNASNIGFDSHSSSFYVYFTFSIGVMTTKWPNSTSLVYNYKNGHVETNNYLSGHGAVWDAAAGTYVIKVENIAGQGVAPTQDHPIIVTLPFPQNTPQYYLTVRTDPSGIVSIPGQGFYCNGTSTSLTAPSYVNVSSSARYRFNNWDVDGTSQGSTNPITVSMNANHTGTAHYVLQYLVTFGQTGLLTGATGTVVTINGGAQLYSSLPYTTWVDNGASVTYFYNSIVASSVSGQQFRLSGISGLASPITVTGTVTVTGNFVTQYLVTFTEIGLDNTATGTVVTANANAKAYSNLPYGLWVDSGSSVTYSYGSIVSSSVSGKQFRLSSVTGSSSPITVAGPARITGNYVIQYLITFAQTGLDSSSTGTVVTINGNAKGFLDLQYTFWADSSSSVTYSYSNVSSSIVGKKFVLIGVGGPSSPLIVTAPATVTGNYKIEYRITFDQSGVGTDFTGAVVTVDSVNYNVVGLPVQFWWDQGSGHSFAFVSTLQVNSSKQYIWGSTSGLSSLQNSSLIAGSSGAVTGNYIEQNGVTFDQIGLNSDFTGTVVVIDGNSYGLSALPMVYYWQIGSVHSFAFQSPLVVVQNSKQYIWTGTTVLSSAQSSSLTVSAFGSIVGNYKTQYCLSLATNPPSVASPSGAGWYDSGTSAPVSTSALVGILPSLSRTRFDNWTTADMTEVGNPTAPNTTVLMDKAKTLTANYLTQYVINFSQSGVGSDFVGTIVTIDGTAYDYGDLPESFWWDIGSSHSFAFATPLSVNSSLQYSWSSTSGLATTQTGSLSVSGSGSVIGNYTAQISYQIIFNAGVGPDWTSPVLTVDGFNYTEAQLPFYFWWTFNSVHSFAFQSPLTVEPNFKQCIWDHTTGLSTAQSGSITVTSNGTITGHYKIQYYLTLATNPSGVNSPIGAGWYDAGTVATVSTDAFVDITPGAARYRFNGWTAANMTGISDPTRSPTNVSMDSGMTVTANYVAQYKVYFDGTGVGSDFTGTVLTVDVINYNGSQLPISFWLDSGTSHNFAYQSPLVVAANNKQYVWTNTTGIATTQSGTLTVSVSGSLTGSYKIQYYFSSPSPYDSPSPANGWFDSGATITASVVPTASGPLNTQYVCTGWTGTGSVPTPGAGATVTFTIMQPSTIAWNWKTQYYLTVITSPSGIVSPSGNGWYDSSAPVAIRAPSVSGYTFSNWDVDGTPTGSGASEITVIMDTPHVATAHYSGSPPQPGSSVGGSSFSLVKPAPLSYFGVYSIMIAAGAAVLSLRKRKRK